MKELIIQNWPSIVIVLFILIGSAAAWKLGKKTMVRTLAYRIVQQIDVRFDEAPDEAFNQVYKNLPAIIRLLYRPKDLRKVIDSILEGLENALEPPEEK